MAIAADTPVGRGLWPDTGDRALIGLVSAHVLVAVAVGLAFSFPFNGDMAGLLAIMLGILMPWFVWINVTVLIVRVGVFEKSSAPLRQTMAIMGQLARDFRWQAESVGRFLLVVVFIGASGYLKEAITVIQPFAWDVWFAEFDRALHFGTDPWRLLMPVTGSYAVTKALNIVYHAWFFAIYFCVFTACFSRGHSSRAFLLAFVLAFAIGGNLLALVFSSAGPVYFERLGLGSDFAPLMAHLQQLNDIGRLPALEVQEFLWQAYQQNGGYAAISAMPSMHVATSVLMACFAFAHSRVLGWIMVVFASLMMVGSVQLGWHYAVDGYFGAVLAVGFWHLSMRWVCRG